MMDETNKFKFAHIGVEKKTHKKIAMLAQVHGVDIYELAEILANAAWETAKQAGLVTDAALEGIDKAHIVGHDDIVEFDIQDGRKLLKAIQPKTKVRKSSKSKKAVKA